MQQRKAVTNAAGLVVALWFFFGVFGGHVTWLGFKGLLLLACSWFTAHTLAGRGYDRVTQPDFRWRSVLPGFFPNWADTPNPAPEPDDAQPMSAHALAAIPDERISTSRSFDSDDGGLLAGFPPAQREVYHLVMQSSLKDTFKHIYHRKLIEHDLKELEKWLRVVVLPNIKPHERDAILTAGGSSRFASGEELRHQNFLVREAGREPDAIVLGIAEPPTANPPHPLVLQGEGHIATIATTGAGKGQRYILPTLMTYPGNVICLDPKGENYRHTKGARDLFGKLFRWAPFDKSGATDSFNPLDVVHDADDARVLADLLVNPSDSGEQAFWESSARDVVRGLILYVKTLPAERRNVRELVRYLYGSEDDLDALRQQMSTSDDEMVREGANQLDVMAEKMFTSILQSARTELDAWRSPAIVAATSHTSDGWDIENFVITQRSTEKLVESGKLPGPVGYKVHSDGKRGVIERGAASSVFFVVPPDRIRSYASVLRVMLGMHLKALTVAEADYEMEFPDMLPEYPIPSLLLFDELPQLGYMQIVEEQILIARAARIRMWLVAQNLSQLQKAYPNWQSMIANCRVQIYFGTNDTTTAREISERCGVRSNVFNEVQPLASVTDITGRSFADHAIMFARGTNPVKMRLPPPFHADPRMERIRDFLRQTDSIVPRRERERQEESLPSGSFEDEPDAESGQPGVISHDALQSQPSKSKRKRRRKSKGQSGGVGNEQALTSKPNASAQAVPSSPRRRPRPRSETDQ